MWTVPSEKPSSRVDYRKDQTNLSDASDESLLTIVRDEMFVYVKLICRNWIQNYYPAKAR